MEMFGEVAIYLARVHSPFFRPETLRVLRDIQPATAPSFHRTIRITTLHVPLKACIRWYTTFNPFLDLDSCPFPSVARSP